VTIAESSTCLQSAYASRRHPPPSNLDLCVVLPQVTRELRDAVYAIAWEIGFDEGRVLAPIVLSQDDFNRAPLSASTLVANIRREGIAA
jgi:hypothetical protein